MRSRLLTLALAITTGMVAVAIVYLYVRQLESDTTRGMKTRPVVFSTRSWPAGTPAEEMAVVPGGLEVRAVPERYATPDAFTSLGELQGLVLKDSLAAGEQLSALRFSSSERDAFAAQFPLGTQALSLAVEHVRAIGGHVAAGDRLNAFVTKTQGSTSLIAQRVRVIEVQPAPADDPEGLSTMVLAVTEPQAQRLINAQERAGLWFTLITEGES
jgi:Flp pilus assembly protein CpaB